MKYGTLVIVLFVSCVAGSVYARPAKVFMIKKPGAEEIVIDRSHIKVTFTAGWVSKRDSLFMTIFRNETKLTADASAAGTYFDGEQLKNAWIVENLDVGHTLDRPGVKVTFAVSAGMSDNKSLFATPQLGSQPQHCCGIISLVARLGNPR